MDFRPYILAATLVGVPVASTGLNAQSFNAVPSLCGTSATTPQLVDCFARWLRASNARLNETYNKIINVLSSGDRQRLSLVEQRWIAYRDSACLAERRLFDGGTAAFYAEPACRQAETEARIAMLERQYGWLVQKSGK